LSWSQVDADPAELRAFARQLKHIAERFENRRTKMISEYKGQSSHWGDQRYTQFGQVIEQNSRFIAGFAADCRSFAKRLDARARSLEDAASVRFTQF